MSDYKEYYTLTKQSIEDGRVVSKTEMTFESIYLDDVLMRIDAFIKASGFCPKGELGYDE